ncbi:MAG: hypothetical protein AAFV43_11075 [Planctomycetota bacterium]
MNDDPTKNQPTETRPPKSQLDAAEALAQRIEQRLLKACEKLNSGEHNDLRESLNRLHACSQLLKAPDQTRFLQEELEATAKQIARIERRMRRQRQTDRQQDSGFSFGM